MRRVCHYKMYNIFKESAGNDTPILDGCNEEFGQFLGWGSCCSEERSNPGDEPGGYYHKPDVFANS